MTYMMFIDDERFPPDDGGEWVVCRCFGDVRMEVLTRGFPSFVSFDHDLGHGMQSGYEIARWMVEADLSGWIYGDGLEVVAVSIPDDFDFYVHSQNPVGARNIESLLRRYLTFRETGE